jgi:hypothetical protein
VGSNPPAPIMDVYDFKKYEKQHVDTPHDHIPGLLSAAISGAGLMIVLIVAFILCSMFPFKGMSRWTLMN